MPCVNLNHLFASITITKTSKKPTVTAKVQAAVTPQSAPKTAEKASKTPQEEKSAKVNYQTRHNERLVKDIARTVQKTVKKAPKPAVAPQITSASFKISHRPTLEDNSRPPLNSERRTRSDLINAESALGSTIFGPIPVGHRREFFHDHNNIWIWHEDWYDYAAHRHQITVRYEVRQDGVFKKVSAGAYFKLEGDELQNFRRATHIYLALIKKNLYNRA